ncbi:MAG TPA: hypothetical protein VGK19_25360 [Capsulimonadaceae bacterium]|jgi:hypothetical protein
MPQLSDIRPILQAINGLPGPLHDVIVDVATASTNALGPDLISLILFGSAAEGKVRASSDLSLLFVLERFQLDQIDPLRDTMRTAYSTARVRPMFLLHDEIQDAVGAFAMKFQDIVQRHVVLLGSDPFSDCQISREASVRRLKDELLNLSIRQRAQYISASLREEQLVAAIADMAGPLRVAASTILTLQQTPAESPKAALAIIVGHMGLSDTQQTLDMISTARELRTCPAGAAPDLYFHLIEITKKMREIADRL